jgi:hypothetical protein
MNMNTNVDPQSINTSANTITPPTQDVQEPTESAMLVNLDGAADQMRRKILILLETYPYISRPMVQVGLGPATPPKLWDPVLSYMLTHGEVMERSMEIAGVDGRQMTKQIFHLPKFPFPPQTIEDANSIYREIMG